MHTSRYKTVPYKVAALASHVTDTGVWSYYRERLRRHFARQPVHFYSADESERVYGRYVHDVDSALRAVGLEGGTRDPHADHRALFEHGNRRIEKLSVPFRQLGLAGSSDLKLVYSAALALGARDILETGVALGWSSLVFLKAAEVVDGRLVSVDLPYPFLIGRSWVGAAVPDELHARWTLLTGSDRSTVPTALALSNGYDLVHYDSDKSPQGRQWAYPKLWQGLRPGGLLLSDDVGDNRIWADFCDSVGVPLIVVRRRNTFLGLARKPASTEPDTEVRP